MPELHTRVQGIESAMAYGLWQPLQRPPGIWNDNDYADGCSGQDMAEQQWERACQRAEADLGSCHVRSNPGDQVEQDLAEKQWKRACQRAEADLSSCDERAYPGKPAEQDLDEKHSRTACHDAGAELSSCSEYEPDLLSDCPVQYSPWHFLTPADCMALCVCSRGHWNRVAGCTPIGQIYDDVDDRD